MSYRFCPHCASALEHVEASAYRRRCPGCGWLHWGNPRPTVCGLVERQGAQGTEVMLVRRAIAPFKSCWDIPGGFVELHEDATSALRRELREEANVEIGEPTLLGAWNDCYPYGGGEERTLNFVFVAPFIGGVPRAGDDACALGWFAAGRLPPDEAIAFDSGVAAVRAWRARGTERGP